MIESDSNEKVKRVINWQKSAKRRNADRIFIVEGIRLFSEAPQESIKEVFYTEKCESYVGDFREKSHLVSEKIMEKMSDTETPQGVLAVVEKMTYSLLDILRDDNPFIIIVENLQDPGNLGTIIRMGEAAGVSGIVMSRGTVDVYNPKVVRSTMGSIFRVPFVVSEDLSGAIGEMKKGGVSVYAAHLQGSEIYTDYDYTKPTAFMIGNEGNGLTDELTSLADKRLFIPMEGRVESLNAGVAASILAYEVYRQRRI